MNARNSLTYRHALLAGAMAVTIGAISQQAQAGSGYDNPSMGRDGSCVGLTGYDVQRSRPARDGDQYRVNIGVENVCGRTMELRLCLEYKTPVDGESGRCFEEILRPGSAMSKRNVPVAGQLVGPKYDWRMLKYDTYD